jgi:hypothetical protein
MLQPLLACWSGAVCLGRGPLWIYFVLSYLLSLKSVSGITDAAALGQLCTGKAAKAAVPEVLCLLSIATQPA